MATHSSVLAWRIPGTGEPGGLPAMGSQRAGHDCSDLAAAAATGAQPGSRAGKKHRNKPAGDCLSPGMRGGCYYNPGRWQ